MVIRAIDDVALVKGMEDDGRIEIVHDRVENSVHL